MALKAPHIILPRMFELVWVSQNIFYCLSEFEQIELGSFKVIYKLETFD
jgi:hypothetical protein